MKVNCEIVLLDPRTIDGEVSGWHVIDPITSEFTLCGTDAIQSATQHSILEKPIAPIKKRKPNGKVTCQRCIELISFCIKITKPVDSEQEGK